MREKSLPDIRQGIVYARILEQSQQILNTCRAGMFPGADFRRILGIAEKTGQEGTPVK